MSKRFLDELEQVLLEPDLWESAGVPESILDAAYAAADMDNLVAIGKTDELGWFLLVRQAEEE